MRRTLITVLAAALLTLGMAAPADAHHRHRRCRDRYDYCRDRGRSACVFRYYVGPIGADFLCSYNEWR